MEKINLENESKEFLEYLVEHCETNNYTHINEGLIEVVKESFEQLNEVTSDQLVQELETIHGVKGIIDGSVVYFELKDGTFAMIDTNQTVGKIIMVDKYKQDYIGTYKSAKDYKKMLHQSGLDESIEESSDLISLKNKIKKQPGYKTWEFEGDYEELNIGYKDSLSAKNAFKKLNINELGVSAKVKGSTIVIE